MPKQPAVSGDQAIRALKRGGFVWDRQDRSHVTLRHHDRRRSVTVPAGSRDLPPGTLRAILRQAGLTVEEFRALLK